MAVKKYLVGFLVLVILSASIYVMLPDKVKIYVEKTRTKYYVNENSNWVLGGTEYVHLYDGTTKMRAKSRALFQSITNKEIIIKRTSIWKDNITTIQTYKFDGGLDNVELVPVENEFECFNCQGKIVHYEFRDIEYSGPTRAAVSPESFGHNMKVEWEAGYDWAKVYQQLVSDKLVIRYRPSSSYENYSVRMFDPSPTGNITLYLDGLSEDRKYEYYTNATLFANYSDGANFTICFDIGDAVNHTCLNASELSVNYRVEDSEIIVFNDSSSTTNVSSPNGSVYVDLDVNTKVDSAIFNISGYQTISYYNSTYPNFNETSNLSFGGNTTKYLEWPKTDVVTDAFLDLRGVEGNYSGNYTGEEVGYVNVSSSIVGGDSSDTCYGDAFYNWTKFSMQCSGSASGTPTPDDSFVYESVFNISNPTGIIMYWGVDYFVHTQWDHIYLVAHVYNFTSASWVLLENFTMFHDAACYQHTVFESNITVPRGYSSNEISKINITMHFTDSQIGYCPATAHTLLYFNYSNLSLVENPYLEVGTPDGVHEWNHSGYFTTEETANFTDETNTFLSGCTADAGGDCAIPFLFHSDAIGDINLYGANLTTSTSNYPKDIGIDANQDGVNDILLLGKLIGDWLFQDYFFYDNTRYTALNISRSTAGTRTFYLNVSSVFDTDAEIENLTFKISGYDIDASNSYAYTEEFNDSGYLDFDNSTNYDSPYWTWDDFFGDSRTTLYKSAGSGTITVDVAPGDERIEASISSSSSGGDSDSDSQKWCTTGLNLSQYKKIEFYFTTAASASCSGCDDCWTSPCSVSVGLTSSSTCSTIQGLPGTNSAAGASCYTGRCSDSNSDNEGGTYTLERVEDMGASTYTFKVYEGSTYKGTTSALSGDINYAYTASSGTESDSGCSASCSLSGVFDTIRLSATSGNYTTNLTYTNNFSIMSKEMYAAPTNIEAAKLTVREYMPTGCVSEYYLSNDNGTTFESVTSGYSHAFTSSGDSLKWFANVTGCPTSDTGAIISVDLDITPQAVTGINIDVGIEDVDWNTSVVLNSSNSPQNVTISGSEISDYVAAACSLATSCEVPVVVEYSTGGTIEFHDFNLTMNPNPVTITSSWIETFDPIEFAFEFIYGIVTVLALDIDFFGTHNITVIAHDGDYSVNDSQTIQVRYSDFNVSLPNQTDWWEVFPASNTESNVTPWSQEDTIPIWNVTGQAQDDGIDIYVRTNGSLSSCLTIGWDDDATRNIPYYLIENDYNISVATAIAGVEIVGDKLWYARDQSTGQVYNYWLNGTQISSNSVIASPFGITTNLSASSSDTPTDWWLAKGSSIIYHYNSTWTNVDNVSTNLSNVYGLTLYGGSFYVTDASSSNIYRVNATTGNHTGTYAISGTPGSSAFIGIDTEDGEIFYIATYTGARIIQTDLSSMLYNYSFTMTGTEGAAYLNSTTIVGTARSPMKVMYFQNNTYNVDGFNLDTTARLLCDGMDKDGNCGVWNWIDLDNCTMAIQTGWFFFSAICDECVVVDEHWLTNIIVE